MILDDTPRRATLLARNWHIPLGPGTSEGDARRVEIITAIDIQRCALVVIDAWATHPNDGYARRNEENLPTLVRLLGAFRSAGRPIFHDPSGLPIHPLVMADFGAAETVIPWDPLGSGETVLDGQLQALGITTIFWAGYATNLCLMNKPCGFRNISRLDESRRHFLVRDATIAFESAETLPGQLLHDAACYEVEYYPYGFSCTTGAVVAAFAAARPRTG